MIFTELRFLFFFAVVFFIHWLLPKYTLRKFFLLVCSYIFYAAWDWRFLSLIWISTIVDYLVGSRLEYVAKRPTQRYFLLLTSLSVNLGLLGFFKYYNFFLDSAQGFLAWLGLPASLGTLQVILPVGISFYTFQTLSYTIDVYRGKLKPTRNFFDFALFVAFFPQLVAGPIVRASDFLPQLQIPRRFSAIPVRACLVLFFVGFFKKACVADSIAPAVDAVFSQPLEYTVFSTWQAVWLYAVQIYCDFSGYSDMAIACAGLLGFHFPVNFAYPYFASNITEFWRRWHISLSTWLKDYLYIPLGGNRGSKWHTYRNLMTTMVLGGLWHGAAWRFIVWGALHGGALVGHKVFIEQKPSKPVGLQKKVIDQLVGIFLTFTWVCLAWIFFRANNLSDAMSIVRTCVLFNTAGSESLSLKYLPILIGLTLAHWFNYSGYFENWWQRLPKWKFSAAYGAAFALVFALKPMEYEPFIYFQF